MDDFGDYTVFKTKTSDGREVEMAVIGEFEFEKKQKTDQIFYRNLLWFNFQSNSFCI